MAFLRDIDKSGRLPAFGWCVTQPRRAPRHCSWCGEKYVPAGLGATELACPNCDLIEIMLCEGKP